MSKRTSTLLAQVSALDKGTPFVQLSYELINSPSWRAMSQPCRKLIEFLMLEHMAHGGTENSNLLATYNQLEAFGIARTHINKTLEEAEQLGLVISERGMRSSRKHNYLNRFRLTFLPYYFITEAGTKMYSAPDNEWRKITDDDIARMKGRKPKRLNPEAKI